MNFEEVVLVDFEFNGPDCERPNVVCLVAHELRSGRKFRLWRDQMGTEPPYRIDRGALFVAYMASAELMCHLALGWPLPANVLDLYAEFRRLTNHSGEHQPAAGLLAALAHFRLDHMTMQAKEHWRDTVLRGEPWTAEERAGILQYCEDDVIALADLLAAMPIPNLQQALIRGSHMRAEAWMRHRGIPIDKPLFDRMAQHWAELRQGLIDDLNTRFPVFEGSVLKRRLLEELAVARGIDYWPRTPTGQLCTSEEALELIAQRNPGMAEFCSAKAVLDKLKNFELSVGADGRNRCMLSAFQSKTGRNQPSNTRFVFGLNAALRSLIKPDEGRAIAYLDFSGQEYALAAYFSGDPSMIAAYEGGDPYSYEAIEAGEMPEGGNKRSRPHVRAAFKRAALGTLYGMGVRTLAEYVGVSETRARAWRRSNRETFPRFWQWTAAVQDAAIATRSIQTAFGWSMKVLPDVKSGTLMNFPMQGGGADMLRIACCLAVDRGIPIVAPVHDAIVVESAADDIDDVVAAMRDAMVDASRAVLGGPCVRVDDEIVRFPDRYVDGRDGSPELWATIMRQLERITK
jgi:DNA polymerase family A